MKGSVWSPDKVRCRLMGKFWNVCTPVRWSEMIPSWVAEITSVGPDDGKTLDAFRQIENAHDMAFMWEGQREAGLERMTTSEVQVAYRVWLTWLKANKATWCYLYHDTMRSSRFA